MKASLKNICGDKKGKEDPIFLKKYHINLYRE